MNVDNCDVQPLIPIWMIVNGCLTTVQIILKWFFDGRNRAAQKRNEQMTSLEVRGLGCFNSTIACFLLIWFILGAKGFKCNHLWVDTLKK